MRKIFFLLMLLFISFSSFGQQLNFEIHGTNLADYINLEKKEGNKIIKTIQHNSISSILNQAIKFTGEGIISNDIESIYIFRKSDSTLVSIRHEWETYSRDLLINEDNLTIHNSYKKKYREIKSIIEEKFGKGIDNSIEETYLGDSFGRIKFGVFGDFLWETNDSIKIKLKSDISSLFQKQQSNVYPGRFKITIDIINNNLYNNGINQELNSNYIKSIDNIKNDFFKNMKTENYVIAKDYLSVFVNEKKKEEVLTLSKEKVNYNAKTKLIKNSARKIDLGYTNATILVYEYSKSKKETIEVIFDELGQIIRLNARTKKQ